LGQTLPAPEVCNGADDDCDGDVDDGVASACGDCSESCAASCAGAGCPIALDLSASLWAEPTENGGARLRTAAFARRPLLWAESAPFLIKVDTRTREIVGTYRVAPNDSLPELLTVAVNLAGDAVLATSLGPLTRFGWGECPDRNADGVVSTSSGWRDQLDWTEQGPIDECVVWFVPDLVAASVAIEIRGGLDGVPLEVVWAQEGFDQTGSVVELDAETGDRTGREVSFPFGIGLATGSSGTLWGLDRGTCAVSIDTTSLEVTAFPCLDEGWGAVRADAQGRAWFAGSGTARLDPAAGEWSSLLGLGLTGWGLTVDRAGNGYTGSDRGYRIDATTLGLAELEVHGVAWAIDLDGFVWAIDEREPFTYAATVFDPESEESEQLFGGVVGHSGGTFPYLGGDPTGNQLRNVTPTRGIASAFFAPCTQDERVPAALLSVEGSIPEGTGIDLLFRHATSEEAFADAEWLELGTAPLDAIPVDLVAAAGADRRPLGSTIEVRAVLRTTDGQTGPVLDRLRLAASCSAP